MKRSTQKNHCCFFFGKVHFNFLRPIQELKKDPEPHKQLEVENDVKIEEPAETVKEIAEIVESELAETIAVEKTEEQKTILAASEPAEAALEQ